VPEINVDEITKIVKDAAYFAIGFGLLTVQKAQVQRRELADQFQGQVVEQAKAQLAEARENLEKVTADATSQWEKLSTTVDDRVKLVEERLNDLEDRFEGLLDEIEAKLPEQAAELVAQAREVAKEARGQVRSLVNRAA
jgi:ElaB/YqjD/DUF883 family membrane-anchored ribosome-binding protein